MPRLTPNAVAAPKSMTVTIRRDQRIREGEAATEGVQEGSGARNQEPCPTLVILLA